MIDNFLHETFTNRYNINTAQQYKCLGTALPCSQDLNTACIIHTTFVDVAIFHVQIDFVR